MNTSVGQRALRPSKGSYLLALQHLCQDAASPSSRALFALWPSKQKERLETSGDGEHAPPPNKPTGPVKRFLRDLSSSEQLLLRSTTEGPP
mmetsp:Transcript_11272/g.31312  ORF Transcript_11272/g.31312 Transcript_11272/m.31312 type:complete len:91 (-) Transcript_11272:910-1182(-)